MRERGAVLVSLGQNPKPAMVCSPLAVSSQLHWEGKSQGSCPKLAFRCNSSQKRQAQYKGASLVRMVIAAAAALKGSCPCRGLLIVLLPRTALPFVVTTVRLLGWAWLWVLQIGIGVGISLAGSLNAFSSAWGSPLPFTVPLLCWGGVTGWYSNCCSLTMDMG